MLPKTFTHELPLADGDALVLTLRRLSFIEKVEAAALLDEASTRPRVLAYAEVAAGAIVAAQLASGGECWPTDWADLGGEFWAALDPGAAVDLFLALLAFGRLTGAEKKESATSPSG